MWLASRDRLSEAAARRLEQTPFDLSLESATAAMQAVFADVLQTTDVAPSAQAFCRAYLTPGEASFADDFHALYVEGTKVDSFLDVAPTADDLEKICAVIDARFDAYSRSPDGQRTLSPTVAERVGSTVVQPEEFSFEVWRDRLRSFDDVERGPGGEYRARVASYLTTLDEAIDQADPRIADELVRTYRFHADGSIQSGCWRLLRSRPALDVHSALIKHIVAIAESTPWASELVDVFEDDLPAEVIAQMSDALDAQPREVRLSYVTALKQAERSGSRHAARLLAVIYPNEGH